MRVDGKSDARRALLLFVLWLVAIIACASVAFAQTYSFPLKWTPVESDAPFFYQLGAGTTISTLTAVKDIDAQWTTGAVTVDGAGPWFLAVRTCLPRADADPICGSWRMASRTQDGDDFGPFYPAALEVPVPDAAWLTQ